MKLMQKKIISYILFFISEGMLNQLTKDPNDSLKKSKKNKQSKSRHGPYVPNFIYPFGRFEGCKMHLRKKQMKENGLEKIERECRSRRKDMSIEKSCHSLAKLSNLNLKIYKPPILCKANIKPCHRMVLRPRAHVLNQLNSNQSARSVRQPDACEIYKSSCSAIQPNKFPKLKSTRLSLKARKRKFYRSSKFIPYPSVIQNKVSKALKTPLSHQRGNFKKPINSSITRGIGLKRMPLSQTTAYTAKDLNCLNYELSSRQERYLRRLQRLEARMSKMKANVDGSDWPGKQKVDYCALSARHLRYLRRLRRVDAALQQANSFNSGEKYWQLQNYPHSSTALSCGSFQMLYKKKDNYDCVDRNLSLPLNLKALAVQRVIKKQQKKCKCSASNWLRGKRFGKNTSTFESGFHYNLRKKRQQYGKTIFGNLLNISLIFSILFVTEIFIKS